MKKIKKIIAYSFPLWFIIGLIPWGNFEILNTIIPMWKLLLFQFNGLICLILTGLLLLKIKNEQ